MSNTRVLASIIAVQGVIIGALWFGASQPTATAQIPDQGAQLQKLIDETHTVNTKLDRMIGILEGGKMQVQVTQSK